jgi:5'-nucleotidase (lipoprotein e(P4) family)
MRALPSVTISLLLLAACDPASQPDDRVFAGDDEKADGTGVDLRAAVAPGQPGNAALEGGDRIGFVLFTGGPAQVDLEITNAGTTDGVDTVMIVHGPRDAEGGYRRELAADDDGEGLARLRDLALPEAGHYLVEVRLVGDDAAGTVRVSARCDEGDCATFEPVPGARARTKWVDASAEYRALSIAAYNGAIRRLDALAADGLPERWAAIVDVDETTLSNVAFEAERAAIGGGHSSPAFQAWVRRKASTAMPGARAFFDKVHAFGGKVVAVTNRADAIECAPTKQNLTAVGLGVDLALCRRGSSDKNPRFAAVEAGTAGLPAMPVLIFVGDNIQDFPGMTQDVRFEDEAAMAEFGRRFHLIPNPMYGSWERNP